MEQLPETAELQTFVRVVEARSLSRAAKELRLPRSTLGRRLQRLEQRLGRRLLKRTTRQQALTDAGVEFFQQARALLQGLERAVETLHPDSGGEIRGRVRVSMPAGDQLNETFIAFLKQHPWVQLELDSSNQQVDLVSGGFDLALRAGASRQQSLVVRPLGRTAIAAYASASYLKAHGAPKKLADLSKHKLISPFVRGETPMIDWPLLNGKHVRIKPHLTGNTVTFLRDAAVAGLGIAMIPEAIAAPTLQRVLPKQIGQVTPVAIVFQEKELMAPAVRALIDFIAANNPMDRIARGAHALAANQPR